MINYQEIMAMIEHWLQSEVNGYLGSDYGPDWNSLFLVPLSAPVANTFIEKMKSDIPILKQLSADQLQLWSQDEGFETIIIYLRVANQVAINLNQVRDIDVLTTDETKVSVRFKQGGIVRAGADTPSYLALPVADNLPLYVACLQAAEKLNIPLDVELDPTITAEQIAQLSESLDAQTHRVQLIWSPNLCRPRDAVSLRGRKIPATYIGQYIGDKLLRNAQTNAEGYAPIQKAVAWKDYPFKKKALELRPDLDFEDEQTLEMLANAKVNVVRPIKFKQGVRFVLSDLLTQKQSENSALRLVPAAEIAMRTSNDCVAILKENMLRPTDDFLKDTSEAIEEYLDGAVTAGWLKPADDLGGKPYAFRLTPDQDKPFERVRLYMARRPEGATRTAIFDEDVLVK